MDKLRWSRNVVALNLIVTKKKGSIKDEDVSVFYINVYSIELQSLPSIENNVICMIQREIKHQYWHMSDGCNTFIFNYFLFGDKCETKPVHQIWRFYLSHYFCLIYHQVTTPPYSIQRHKSNIRKQKEKQIQFIFLSSVERESRMWPSFLDLC